MINFKQLRDQLSPLDIVRILGEYGVSPVYENNQYIVFPTFCHNLNGGSHKLYYYLNTRMFRCYTECGAFDIFDLIIKLEELRGKKVGKRQAIEIAGLEVSEKNLSDLAEESIAYELGRLYAMNASKQLQAEPLPVLDKALLDQRFTFSRTGVLSWINEGISYMSIVKYGVRYDPIENSIVIPQWDEKGNLVGIRARFLDVEKGKYRPITFNGEIMRHPLSRTLYGLYHNREAIKQTRSVIIFEGEKSVLRMDTYYDDKSIAIATCGKNISQHHIQLLRDFGVKNIILAYDADYQDYVEATKVKDEYIKLAKPLLNYFNTSIIIDYNGRLGYKDSPIDKGLETFLELQKERIYI